jgi:hypothetical protein
MGSFFFPWERLPSWVIGFIFLSIGTYFLVFEEQPVSENYKSLILVVMGIVFLSLGILKIWKSRTSSGSEKKR